MQFNEVNNKERKCCSVTSNITLGQELSVLHCFMSVTGAGLPLKAWGLMAGLPGLASHGSGLNLGAGCQ